MSSMAPAAVPSAGPGEHGEAPPDTVVAIPGDPPSPPESADREASRYRFDGLLRFRR